VAERDGDGSRDVEGDGKGEGDGARGEEPGRGGSYAPAKKSSDAGGWPDEARSGDRTPPAGTARGRKVSGSRGE